MPRTLREIATLLQKTVQTWQASDAPRMAAALSYYTTFALAPLIILVTVIAGVIFDQAAVRNQILAEVAVNIGADAANLIRDVIDQMSRPQDSLISTVVSIAALLFGAIGVFGQLQGALDRIWDVEAHAMPQGVKGLVINNLLSLGMVLVVGFLLLVSLVISTILSALGSQLNQLFPGAETVVSLANFLISFAVIALLFALIYRLLPHTGIAWGDVLGGAALTALLFTLGKTLLSLYLSRSGTASIYGAAGSLVVLLLWIYYAAQILLLGGAFTRVWAQVYGSRSERVTGIPTARPASAKSKALMGRIYDRILSR